MNSSFNPVVGASIAANRYCVVFQPEQPHQRRFLERFSRAVQPERLILPHRLTGIVDGQADAVADDVRVSGACVSGGGLSCATSTKWPSGH